MGSQDFRALYCEGTLNLCYLPHGIIHTCCTVAVSAVHGSYLSDIDQYDNGYVCISFNSQTDISMYVQCILCDINFFFFPLAKDETTLLARNYLGTRMVKYKQQSAQSIIDTETFNYE